MRSAQAFLATVLLLGVVACEPSDPLERKVSARTATAFSGWRAHINSDSSVENRRRVEEALQESRFKIAGDREIKSRMGEKVDDSAESINDAVRERVDGRPLREVVQYGYELRV